MATRQEVGQTGEDDAVSFFLAQGFAFVDRNWHCRYGEIDVIVERAGTLHFIEVKARVSGFQHPFSAISEQKRAKIENAVNLWRQAHPAHAALPYQVDAFCLWREEGVKKMAWIEGM